VYQRIIGHTRLAKYLVRLRIMEESLLNNYCKTRKKRIITLKGFSKNYRRRSVEEYSSIFSPIKETANFFISLGCQ
jgi:hypothetical protein